MSFILKFVNIVGKSKEVHIPIGVDSKGFKTVPSFMISNSESEETLVLFYKTLLTRGLNRVETVISDVHQGKDSAIQKSFTSSVWQRCQVHFLRNVLDRLPKKIAAVRSYMRDLFKIHDIGAARLAKNNLLG